MRRELNKQSKDKYLIIALEAKKRNMDDIKYWLDEIEQINNIVNEEGLQYYPLIGVINESDYELLEVLIDCKIDLKDSMSGYDMASELCRCTSGNEDDMIRTAELLINNGVDFNGTVNFQDSYVPDEGLILDLPLYAAYNRNIKLAKFLQDYKKG